LEHHAELDPRTPIGQTLLGLLGDEVTAERRAAREEPFLPVASPQQPDVVFFTRTQHTLHGMFKEYWQSTGGLLRHGYPISEEFVEVSRDDGQAYRVQYFERSRLEYHPGSSGGSIQLGRLGAELLDAEGLP
jgi:hypothetical protein